MANPPVQESEFDALIIGAGFSGLYQLLCLRDRLGLSVRLHFATPEEAGTVFTRASPKLAVYNHIILLGDPPPTLAQIVARTRTTYAGPLHIGNDLLVLDIGDQGTVHTAVP